MAGMVKSLCMVLIATIVLAAVAPQAGATISCSTVASDMSGCLSYLTDKGPLGNCCSGVKKLNTTAKSTADRQSTCNCLKSLARSYPNLDQGRAAGLPGTCGINLGFKISYSTDCSKVKAA